MYNSKYYYKYKNKIQKRARKKTLEQRKQRLCRICKKSCMNMKYKYYCSKKCQKEGTKIIAREAKRRNVKWFPEYKKSLGGCKYCGYNKCVACLDFHHPNNDKKVSPSALKNCSFKTAIKELKKCSLLCKNCHYELHSNNGFNKKADINFKIRKNNKKIEENGDV